MIFVDTWAWIALADRRDAHHGSASAQHHQLQRKKRRYVTTDYVLSETITYLYDGLPAAQARMFIQAIFAATDSGIYQLVHVSPQQFRRAWDMRQQYHDKPDISFVDFSSMVVMRDLGIAEVFTGDGHFRQVNLGFRLVP